MDESVIAPAETLPAAGVPQMHPKKKVVEPPKMDFKPWLARIAAAEKYRETFVNQWKRNVRDRLQQHSGSGEDNAPDRLSLPEDWARSKQKAAQLNYQIPKILAKAKHPAYTDKAALVTADLNDVLKNECQASYMVDECLADVINAAGIMVSKIGMERVTETIENLIPLPPLVDALGMTVPNPGKPTVERYEKVVSQKFTWDRLSPANFLAPPEFRKSNWNQAPWLGDQTWMTVEQIRKTWGKKLPADYEPQGSRPKGLTDDIDTIYTGDTVYVKVTEIWYSAWLFDKDKAHPECIRRLVFVEGHDEPVEFDQTDWQEWVDEVPSIPAGKPTPEAPQGTPAQPGRPGYYKGLRKLPIRVETLAYVSDRAIPPSDTEAGSTQVRELLRSRSQMLRQRDHSVPMRWYNPNLVDEEVIESMRRGEWQDMMPVNGDGSRALGEVARANYPRESFQFQTVIGNDLDRAWSLSNNQLSLPSAQGAKSATEVGLVQSASDTRLAYEKGRVNRYLVEGAEVLFSLMQMFRNGTKYVSVPSPDGEVLQEVNPSDLLGEFMFDFMADSSDRVDKETRQMNVLKVYNLLANSDNVERRELERDIVELHGLDSSRIIRKKAPEKAPEPPNISFRFSGEDMLNPMVVSLIMESYGGAFTPEKIKAASMMIQDAVSQVSFKQAQPQPGAPAPAGPPGPPTGGAPVEPPETTPPILKRGASGERLL